MAGVELSAVEAAADLIKTVGFPIVVAGWLLWRTDKRLDRIIDILGEKRGRP